MGSEVEVTAADREKAALKAYIADHAAVWETEFAAGPGLVVSLDDAAHVAAKYIAETRAKALQWLFGVPTEAELGLASRMLDEAMERDRIRRAAEDRPEVSQT